MCEISFIYQRKERRKWVFFFKQTKHSELSKLFTRILFRSFWVNFLSPEETRLFFPFPHLLHGDILNSNVEHSIDASWYHSDFDQQISIMKLWRRINLKVVRFPKLLMELDFHDWISCDSIHFYFMFMFILNVIFSNDLGL